MARSNGAPASIPSVSCRYRAAGRRPRSRPPRCRSPPPTTEPDDELDDPELDDPELDDPETGDPGAEEPRPEPPPNPSEDDEDDFDVDDDDPELDDELDDEPQPDPKLPKLYAHGDPDPRPLVSWLVKHLVPSTGHGLLAGQWGTGKTFVVFDLMASVATGQAFLGHLIKRQCGVLLIAAEGAYQVRLRLDAVVKEKCGGVERIPFRWYETTPLLLQKDATKTLIAMAKQADDSLQEEFGVPLGLVVIDTISACAGYTQAGGESDAATGQAIMGVLKSISQALCCFVFGVHHFGKDKEAGTRGTIATEDASDQILACLGERTVGGTVRNTRLAVGRTRAARRARSIRSPCAWWRRWRLMRTETRSPPWWWIGSPGARVPGRDRRPIRGR